MKRITTLIVICFAFLACLGQTEKTLSSPTENVFIEKHRQQLAVKLSITNNTDFFQIYEQDQHFTLKPNTSLKTNLIFSYRAILFGLGYSPKFIPGNNDDTQKGSSKIFWAGTTVNLRHWTHRLTYNKISGFYLLNSSNLPDNDENFTTFPDLNYTKVSGYTAYKFNQNFSFSAIETQTERQLKSAGSFVPGLVYRYYIIDNRTELTPTNSSQKSNNIDINVQLGYFYTRVINKRFFLSAGAATGGGIIHSKLLTRYYSSSYETKNNYAIFRVEALLAAGYNAKRFFAGMQLVGNLEEYKQQKTTATLNENLRIQLYAGYRFEAPKFLNNIFTKK